MKKMLLLLLSLVLLGSVGVQACRIVPHPPTPPMPPRPWRPPFRLLPISVKKHHIEVQIKDGVAVTTLESVFHNPNNRVLEGTYLFPLPAGASVSKFSMWIDGREQHGELLDANKARELYISIVRRMIDPGLLEFVGRQTFKMRIFPIPARGDKRIKLTYTQILPLDGGMRRYVYPLTTVGNGREDQIGELSWRVRIKSRLPIKSVFSPSHEVDIVRHGNHKVTVSYEGSQVKPDRDFILYTSHSTKKIDLTLVTFKKRRKDGYFLLLLAPQVKVKKKAVLPKDVVFVCDTSGSMAGDKIAQARRALKYCINSLHPQDRFNLIPFSTEARLYQDELIPATKDNIAEALEFIDEEVIARGGTNINEALMAALQMRGTDKSRPFMVVFMTDGKPTIGVRNPKAILRNVHQQRSSNLRIFTFGIGENLDTHLLDELSNQNHGAREYVAPKEDIEVKVSNFFTKLSSPVLTSPQLQFPHEQGIRIYDVYPKELPDLFRGASISVLGRYRGAGDQVIRLKGMVHGQQREFVFEVSFKARTRQNAQIPRLWATRKIGYLLDQIRLHGEEPELKKEVVRLAKRFGIVTPYTSYLVMEDNATAALPTRILRQHLRNAARRKAQLPSSSMPAMESAARSMKSRVGSGAVRASQAVEKLKRATTYDQEGQSPLLRKVMRTIDDKTFYLKNGVWYDSDYDSRQTPIKIKYLSDRYLALLRDKPDIGKYLAIGRQVVVVFEGQVYQIVE